MGARCGHACHGEELTVCSCHGRPVDQSMGELDTAQALDGVLFSPPGLPPPDASLPDVDGLGPACLDLERHGVDYLVALAGDRAAADQIVAEAIRARKIKEASTAKPLHTYSTGATYLGEWSGELRHGQGVQEWPNGSRYEGQWANDRLEGEGRFVRSTGDVYEGQFRNDQVHGRGIFRPVDGATYEGEWEEHKQHGHGEEVWPDGIRYKGQFRNGSKAGRGTFSWPNGSTYEGDFAENAIHGYGFHQWDDGRSYRGQWTREKMNGAGVFTFPDGRSYEGQYVDDLKHGFGMFRWPDGRRYEGQWREGKQHGFAVYHSVSGEVHSGEWEEGRWLRWTGEGMEALPSLLKQTNSSSATADSQKGPPFTASASPSLVAARAEQSASLRRSAPGRRCCVCLRLVARRRRFQEPS